MSKIQEYHAHLYYEVSDIEKAQAVVNKIKQSFDIPVGRVWDKPVGPHPIGSCQITVSNEAFGEFIPWLLENREGFDVFIHAVTGNDLADHTEYVMWIGKSYTLNTEMFR